MAKSKMTKLAVAVTASLTVVGLALPEAAMAHKTKARHVHKSAKHSHRAVRSSVSSSESYAVAGSSVDRRLREMEDEVQSLRSELAKTRSSNSEQIQAHQAQVDEKLAAVEEKASEGKDLLFFRGGFTKMEHARGDELLTGNKTLSALTGTPDPGKSGEGWYVGAGFDHRLTDDLWGMTDAISVDGEVMFEYKNYGANTNSYVNAQLVGLGLTPQGIKNQVTQFTLTASPKIKFNNLGIVRPWIIPFGLGIHVVSPPSSGVTVLNPGLMVGTGMDINLWKSVWAGIDFRYHFTGDDLNYRYRVGGQTILNKVDTDGFTTGAYLGFGF